MIRTRNRINEILAYHTGQPADVIRRDTERDYWMTADEAKTYGVVDEVLTSPALPEQPVTADTTE
jgi:ATP-dependent Clp protease protease subunit